MMSEISHSKRGTDNAPQAIPLKRVALTAISTLLWTVGGCQGQLPKTTLSLPSLAPSLTETPRITLASPAVDTPTNTATPTVSPTPQFFDIRELKAGDYIAYCGYDGLDAAGNPKYALFLVSLSDGSQVRIASGLCEASLSPDGITLAYEDNIYNPVIHLLDLESRQDARIEGTIGCYLGSWSPDGTMLALGCSDDEIHVVSVQGHSMTTITECSSREGSCLDPAWSPDGSVLAYSYSKPFSPNNGLYTVPTDCLQDPQTCPRQARYRALLVGPFVWSADSNSVAYLRNYTEIGILSIKSGALRTLTVPLPPGNSLGKFIRSTDDSMFAYVANDQVVIWEGEGSIPKGVTSGLTYKQVEFWLHVN